MTVAIHIGDCRNVLRTLPAESVHCVVTSPPYWGLRDYGTAKWEGGDPACDHSAIRRNHNGEKQETSAGTSRDKIVGNDCGKCGAARIDSQIGLEPDFRDYVAAMVAVFREVRRVLRKDGTLWLNLGDSYANTRGGKQSGLYEDKRNAAATWQARVSELPAGLKPKDLCGIPWRVAQALQAPYYTGKIKNEIDRVWLAAMIDAEGCMFIHRRKEGQSNGQGYVRKNDTYGVGLEVSNTSEAVVRRCNEITGQGSICTQGPEQNYRRKQILYRWNMRTNECCEIIREIYPYLVAKKQQARIVLGCPASGKSAEAAHQALIGLHNGCASDVDFPEPNSMYEQGWFLRQDVIWSKLNPMPESVTDRCTKAHEYLFLLAKSERYFYDANTIAEIAIGPAGGNIVPTKGAGQDLMRTRNGLHLAQARAREAGGFETRNKRSVWEVTTQPFSEAHFATFPPALIEPCIKAGCPAGGIVLDPFAGAGTTGLVADRLQRSAILIELNPDYSSMSERRIVGDAPLFAHVARETWAEMWQRPFDFSQEPKL